MVLQTPYPFGLHEAISPDLYDAAYRLSTPGDVEIFGPPEKSWPASLRAASPTSTLSPPGEFGRDAASASKASPLPRSAHHRKSLHPHRASEAVADDPDDDHHPHTHPSRRSPTMTPPPPPPVHHRVHPLEYMLSEHPVRQIGARKSPARSGVSPGNKECHDCHTQKTPMWRRVGDHNYCNACGLRRKRAECGR